MAVRPVMRTWVAGEPGAASYLNANLRDLGTFLLGPPRCRLRQTTVGALTNNAWTSVLLDTEDLDSDNMHSTSTNTSRATAVTAGDYWVAAGVTFALNGTGDRGIRFAVNGTALQGRQMFAATAGSGGQAPELIASRMVSLAVGDYVEVQAFQSSGGSLNTRFSSPDLGCYMDLWLMSSQ